MEPIFSQLCLWADESVQLCQKLQELLTRERSCLIRFNSTELTEVTMAKEVTVAKIFAARRQIRQLGEKHWQVTSSDELEKKLPAVLSEQWAIKQTQWREIWKQTRTQTERNQEFLKHSQRNLGRIIEHWRRQMGDNPLYSARGQKVEKSTTGKVLEAKF